VVNYVRHGLVSDGLATHSLASNGNGSAAKSK
jgi:hypothetical protein